MGAGYAHVTTHSRQVAEANGSLLGTNKGLLNRAPARHQVNDQNNRCYNQQEMYHPATYVSQESE